MENQNILTIKFNDTEDLALKIAEWNEILNHQCCGNCHDEKHPAEQVTKAMCETAPKAEPATKQEKQKTPEITDDDLPVLPLDADPSPKAELQPQPVVQEKVKSVPKPEPVEPKEERTPQQEEIGPKDAPAHEVENTLDVTPEPVDKKAFYKEFRAWMGEDGVKAKKALAIFSKHGITRPSSDSLTDDLITDLKSIMAEKEA